MHTPQDEELERIRAQLFALSPREALTLARNIDEHPERVRRSSDQKRLLLELGRLRDALAELEQIEERDGAAAADAFLIHVRRRFSGWERQIEQVTGKEA